MEAGLQIFILIHEEARDDLVDVDPGDTVVLVLIDHVDEVHGLYTEAEESDPLFEVHMLLFQFFDECGEEGFHLFLDDEHLGYLGVGVLADYVLKLAPKHGFTMFMEEGTFTF